MSQNRSVTHQKLSTLWREKSVKTFDTRNQKYAIFSDLHLGDGSGADDFRHNEQVMVAALEHYRVNGYNLILLGDIEEFWQFDLEEIIDRYGDSIYRGIRKFGDNGVFRVFGNHDAGWGISGDPILNNQKASRYAEEAIKLRDKHGRESILLVHGHQGSEMSDKNNWFSRFFVRLFRFVEPLLRRLNLYRNPSTADSRIVKDYERIFYSWAKKNQVIVICGHSHRAIFASKSYSERLVEEINTLKVERELYRHNREMLEQYNAEITQKLNIIAEERYKGREIEPVDPDGKPLPCYFNSGCALYTDGITTMEIADDQIKIVKWHAERSKHINCKIYHSVSLSKITDEIKKGKAEPGILPGKERRRSRPLPRVKV